MTGSSEIQWHGPLEPGYFHPQWCLDYNPECSVQENMPEFDLKEESSRLHFILNKKTLTQLPPLLKQFHQILMAPKLLQRFRHQKSRKNQGNARNNKGASNSTRPLPSSHKIFKDQLEKYQKELVAEEKKRKSESSKSGYRNKVKREKNLIKKT
ncbi:hypothetical protein VP01_3669g1 [Puccinia sorghi]|uniref:Uncharacterized protein n=1 Tax=Puccinia sorghi TaxID=27349 RepID=A0A0L6UUD8_9BASI|nr:hypothetical protein VP01_3669g1 [Puccinia sorghi]